MSRSTPLSLVSQLIRFAPRTLVHVRGRARRWTPLADRMRFSVSLSASPLSGYTTTSSRYQTRQALPSLARRSLLDTRRADRVYLVWKSVIRCVILSSSDLREDGTDGLPVLVLFILVGSPPFRDGISDTTDNKEQVLATMPPAVDISREVSIPVGPLFLAILTELPNSILLSRIHKAGAQYIM